MGKITIGSKVDALIHLNNDKVIELAKELHLSKSTLYSKINGSSEFKANELITIAKRYNVNLSYFD